MDADAVGAAPRSRSRDDEKDAVDAVATVTATARRAARRSKPPPPRSLLPSIWSASGKRSLTMRHAPRRSSTAEEEDRHFAAHHRRRAVDRGRAIRRRHHSSVRSQHHRSRRPRAPRSRHRRAHRPLRRISWSPELRASGRGTGGLCRGCSGLGSTCSSSQRREVAAVRAAPTAVVL